MAHRILPLIAAIALVVAACGSDSNAEAPVVNAVADAAAAPSPTSTTTVAPPTTSPVSTTIPNRSEFPVTVETVSGSVTIEERPEHIVSLSPTSTEVLFAIGAGDQVVAVDDQSNFPADAPISDLTGFDPNLEAIAGYGADLVVLMYDPGDVVDGLSALGIPVLLMPAAATLDIAYQQIEATGVATGHFDEARAVVEAMEEEIGAIGDSVDGGGATYYHEVSPDYYTATSQTFVGSLYAMFGLINIADDADPEGFGYPQLSGEHILAEDPELIFLADTECCAQSAATVAERPGWDTLSAVESGAIVELDDDVASRWGPRVVDLVGQIASAVVERANE
jgi:iron complex transport system substrate-binding protein